jgi:hypothetical protein
LLAHKLMRLKMKLTLSQACCSLKDNPIDFFLFISYFSWVLAKIMTASWTNTMIISNVFECDYRDMSKIMVGNSAKVAQVPI